MRRCSSRHSSSATSPKSWTSTRPLARIMRFHLDEHVPHAIAEGLRRRGIDVTTRPNAPQVMPDRIRFHLNEHVDPAIGAGLQCFGIDVTTPDKMRNRVEFL